MRDHESWTEAVQATTGAPVFRRILVWVSRDFHRRMILSSAATAFILLLAAASAVLMARVLGPAGRGALGLALVWSWSLVVFTSIGLDHAMAFRASRDPHDARALWGRAILAAVLQGVAGTSLGELLIHVLVRSSAGRSSVQVAILFLPMALLTLYQLALLQGMERFGRLNLGRLLQPIAWFAVALTAYVTDFRHPTLLAAGFGATQVFGMLASGYLLYGTVGGPQIMTSGLPPLLKYGSFVWLAGVSRSTNLRLDQIVLGALTTTTAIGLYAAGVSIAAILTIVSTSVALVTLPSVARLAPDAAYRRGLISTVFAGLLMAAAAVALWLLAPWFVPLLLGRRFEPAIRPFRVLVVAQIFVGMNTILHETSNGLGHPGLPALVEGVGALATVGLLIATVPRLGIMAAAWISLAVYGAVFLGLLAGLSLVRKTAGTRLRRMLLEEELTRNGQVSE